MVEKETETQISEPKTEKSSISNIDVTEIIDKVKGFVDRIKEISAGGKPVDVKVDSFTVSFSKAQGEYELVFNTKIAVKPKEN